MALRVHSGVIVLNSSKQTHLLRTVDTERGTMALSQETDLLYEIKGHQCRHSQGLDTVPPSKL